jgi:hypothetical protein
MVSANLKSNQGALTFLGKNASDNDRESFKKVKQNQNQKDFT